MVVAVVVVVSMMKKEVMENQRERWRATKGQTHTGRRRTTKCSRNKKKEYGRTDDIRVVSWGFFVEPACVTGHVHR